MLLFRRVAEEESQATMTDMALKQLIRKLDQEDMVTIMAE